MNTMNSQAIQAYRDNNYKIAERHAAEMLIQGIVTKRQPISWDIFFHEQLNQNFEESTQDAVISLKKFLTAEQISDYLLSLEV